MKETVLNSYELSMKAIPIFKDLKTEVEFWEREDFAKYIDWNKAVLTGFLV